MKIIDKMIEKLADYLVDKHDLIIEISNHIIKDQYAETLKEEVALSITDEVTEDVINTLESRVTDDVCYNLRDDALEYVRTEGLEEIEDIVKQILIKHKLIKEE